MRRLRSPIPFNPLRQAGLVGWLGFQLLLPAGTPAADSSAAPAAKTFSNVRDYGAVGDGQTLDSPAINAAILTSSQTGGGTVFHSSADRNEPVL